MFASRIIRKTFIPRMNRMLSSGTFHPKSTREVWLGDAGAYPIMGVIGFALAFCTVFGLRTAAVDSDARLSKDNRKNPFRGEMTYDK